MPAPGYTAYVAPEKYAQIAWIIGLGGKTERERRERLFAKVEELLDRVEMPRSLEQAGVSPRRVRCRRCPTWRGAPSRTRACARTRVFPLVRELTALLEAGFRGW